MLEKLIEQKKTDSDVLSKQFDQWLYKDRGRKIRGIEYFLNQRSENIDKLIRSKSTLPIYPNANPFALVLSCCSGKAISGR